MAMNTLISAVKAYVERAVSKLPSREELEQAKDEAESKYLQKKEASQYVSKEELEARGYITESSVFVAVYGETAYDEVSEQVSAGRPVIVMRDNTVYTLSEIAGGDFKFSAVNNARQCFLFCTDDGHWSYGMDNELAYDHNIPTEDEINALIDAKLGVIENGAY